MAGTGQRRTEPAGKPQKIFFSGIGGSGVSAIASFMADKGHEIYGSDRAFDKDPDNPVCKILQSKGIRIAPQDGSGIDTSFDFAVFSTAVEQETPDFLRVRQSGIPYKFRPDYLAEIVLSYKTIAVSGTSGKSTTTGLLAFLMQRLGLSPNFVGGGRVKNFRTDLNTGNSVTGDSEYLVIEACESDGSIVNYKPLHTILLNLDLDHHRIEKTYGMFQSLINNTNGRVFINADDKNLENIKPGDVITFSIDAPSLYRPEYVTYKHFGTDFKMDNTNFSLSLPGRHNLYNALSAIAVLDNIGVPMKDISPALHEFQGIERRFDIHLNHGRYLVVDDYAHNPHKISALMKTIKNIRDSVCYIFQPHGFAPIRLMKDEYIRAFADNLGNSDHLMLLPVYYAGGTAAMDISSDDIAAGVKAKGKPAEVSTRKKILGRLDEWQSYVVFGARDESLSGFAKELAGGLKRLMPRPS